MAATATDTQTGRFPLRIVVVEDEPLIRFHMAEVLRDMGASVIEAATADEAWAYLSQGGDADLVFTDHRMPGTMTGVQLATRIRRERPGLPVMVTSAILDITAWEEGIIEKPYGLFVTALNLIRLAQKGREAGSAA